MANAINLIVYPAKDLDKTKKFFSTFLNTEPYVDGDYYVGYKTGDTEVGIDPNGTAVINYIEVDDIHASIKTLTEVGGEVVSEPRDVGGGMLIAQVKIEDSVVGLRQTGN